MVLVLPITVPLKFSLVIEEHTLNTWFGGVGGKVTRQLVVGTFNPVTAWFTTNTWLAACCTAWTGARPTSLTLMSESPETSTTMALPGTTVPLSLMATTVWAAFGLGKVGGFGMIIGRKVSPQPLQITYRNSTDPSQRNRLIQTPWKKLALRGNRYCIGNRATRGNEAGRENRFQGFKVSRFPRFTLARGVSLAGSRLASR